MNPKILLFDIETFPLLVETWGVYEQDALRVLRNFTICCFGAKWLGEKNVTVRALCDYGYKPSLTNVDDSKIVREVWSLLNEADIVIAHNGNSFDVKKVNARFAVHGLPPPSPYKTIDTKVQAKNVFGFDSNKLNELGRQLDHGTKEETGGYQLWIDCMENKKEAWARMKKYNRRDVELLEKIYLDFRPWIKSHPNVAVFNEGKGCPRCGSVHIKKDGIQRNNTTSYQRYKCLDCGGPMRGNINLQEIKPFVNIG